MHRLSARTRFNWAIALTVLIGVCASRVDAHKLNVFATVEGDAILGECYSSGGGRPEGILVRFLDASGSELGRTHTDAEGRFRFEPKRRTDHIILVETTDGHRAEFVVPADELAPDLAQTDTPQAGAAEGSETETGPLPPDIEKTISEAVSRELRPLRRQLDRLENTVRFRDIVGGIGYIFGLAGVALYFSSRSKGRA